MKKRILLILLALVLALTCLASCGAVEEPKDEPSDPTDNTGNIEASSFSVRFYDENGNLLNEATYDKDATPSYTYTKTDDARYSYTVEGWSKTKGGSTLSALPAVTANASYFAVVTKTAKTVSLNLEESEDLTASALSQMQEMYEGGIEGLSSVDKAFVEAVYTYVQYSANTLEEESSDDLNALYNVLFQSVNIAKGIGMSDNSGAQKAGEQLDMLLESIAGLNEENVDAVNLSFTAAKAMLENTANYNLYKNLINEGISSISEFIISAGAMPIEEAVESMKATAVNALATIINISKAIITDEDKLTEIDAFYKAQLEVIDSIASFTDLKKLSKVMEDSEEFFGVVLVDAIESAKEFASGMVSQYEEVLAAQLIDEETATYVSGLLKNIQGVIEDIPSEKIAQELLSYLDTGSSYAVDYILSKIQAITGIDEEGLNNLVNIIERLAPTDSEFGENVAKFISAQFVLIKSVEEPTDFLAVLPQVVSNFEDFVEDNFADASVVLKNIALEYVKLLVRFSGNLVGEENAAAIQKVYEAVLKNLEEAESLIAIVSAIQSIPDSADEAFEPFVMDVIKANKDKIKSLIMYAVNISVSEVPEDTQALAEAYVAFVESKVDAILACTSFEEIQTQVSSLIEEFTTFFTKELNLTEEELVQRFIGVFDLIEEDFNFDPSNPLGLFVHLFLQDVKELVEESTTMEEYFANLAGVPEVIANFTTAHFTEVKTVFCTYTKFGFDMTLYTFVFPLVQDETYRATLSNFYEAEWAKVTAAETIEELDTVFSGLAEEIDTFFETEFTDSKESLVKAVEDILTGLQVMYKTYIQMLPVEGLDSLLDGFFPVELAALKEVTEYDELKAFLISVPVDLEYYLSGILQSIVSDYFNMAINFISKVVPENTSALLKQFVEDVNDALDELETVLLPDELISFYASQLATFIDTNSETLIKDTRTLLQAILEGRVSSLSDAVKANLMELIQKQFDLVESALLGTIEEDKPFDVNFVCNFLPYLNDLYKAYVERVNEDIKDCLEDVVAQANAYVKEEHKVSSDDINAIVDIYVKPGYSLSAIFDIRNNTYSYVKSYVNFMYYPYIKEAREIVKKEQDVDLANHIYFLGIEDEEILSMIESVKEDYAPIIDTCEDITEMHSVGSMYYNAVLLYIDSIYQSSILE